MQMQGSHAVCISLPPDISWWFSTSFGDAAFSRHYPCLKSHCGISWIISYLQPPNIKRCLPSRLLSLYLHIVSCVYDFQTSCPISYLACCFPAWLDELWDECVCPSWNWVGFSLCLTHVYLSVHCLVGVCDFNLGLIHFFWQRGAPCLPSNDVPLAFTGSALMSGSNDCVSAGLLQTRVSWISGLSHI